MNRAGGLVACGSAEMLTSVTCSPCARAGRRTSFFLPDSAEADSSSPSSYAARKPGKVTTVPLALNSALRPSLASAMSLIVVVAIFASAIWEATVRFQISS